MKTATADSNAFMPVVAGVLLVLLTSCTSTPEGNPDDGKRWFSLYRCIGCHGEQGKGGKAPTLAGLNLSYSRFIHKLRNPNSAVMPTFEEDRLSDSDAADIYLWLQNLDK